MFFTCVFLAASVFSVTLPEKTDCEYPFNYFCKTGFASRKTASTFDVENLRESGGSEQGTNPYTEFFSYLDTGAAAIPEAELQRILAADGTGNNRFGFSVSIDGDTLVVGAPNHNIQTGAAYIFIRSGGSWVQQAKLFSTTDPVSEQFGVSVDISGDTVVIGARFADVGSNADQGAAYIYTRNGSNWSLQQKIVAAGGYRGAQFGNAVAIDFDTVVVGAQEERIDNVFRGAAYVFTRSGGVWSEQARLTDSLGSLSDRFGYSVAIENDTAVVGALYAEAGTNSAQGAASVFKRTGTTWTEQARLSASDGGPEDFFGTGVAIDNSRIIVGAEDARSGPGIRTGAAYIFEFSGINWTERQKLVPSDPDFSRRFGGSVDISGDTAVIGAYYTQIGSSDLQGAAYVFVKNGDVWMQQARLFGTDGAAGDFFGASVSVSGRRIIAGAPNYDVGTTFSQGAVYFFITPAFAPDLQAASDTGISAADNITNSRNLVFDIGGITPGATVELLRDGTVVSSSPVSGTAVTLSDPNAPANGTFEYTSRQIVNGEASSLSEVTAVTIDTLTPSVTVNQSSADPTANLPLNFAFTFSEPVFGFSASDISLNGSTANVANAVVTLSPSGENFFIVNNIISDGQFVRASIPADGFTDAAGNPNTASTSTDNTITVDNVRPQVTVNQAENQMDPTAGQPIDFTVTFSEPVTGFNANDIWLFNSTANTSGAVITITGSGLTYNVAVSGITSNGQTVRAEIRAGSVQDGLGNSNNNSTSTDNTVTLDNVAPTVTVNQAAGQSDPATVQPVNFRVVFSEPVTGFAPADVSLAGSTADVSLANIVVTGSGAIYNVAVGNITSSGQVRAGVAANAAQDELGNLSLASTSTDNTITFKLVKSLFDFDGDGRTDISVFRPAAGEWWILRSSDNQAPAVQFGSSTDRIVPADFTGDDKTDIAFFRESTGEWFVIRSEDFSFYAFPFGSAGDKPVAVDFDGDGKCDPTVFRPSNAVWYTLRSSDGQISFTQFGAPEDVPLPADYDGDGKADLGVFRPSVSEWWILRSGDGGVTAFPFGSNGDKPTPADFTGDGKTDVAFWRPSTGFWYILRSEDNSFYAFPFGSNGDIPASGDFDGDGRFDPAVFRPSNSTWYLLQTTNGFSAVAFGALGDQPVPAVFMP